jgi:DNA-binding CsgD family transcriptional regulator
MALERAAELTPERADQARRRFHAGVAAWVGGQPSRAERNLDLALRLTADPLLRADVQHARGRMLYAAGSLNDAHALLLDEAARVQEVAPERAVAMLNDACIVCSGAAEIGRGLVAARLAMKIARRADRESQFLAALGAAQPLLLAGRTKEGQRLLRKWKGFAAEYFTPPLPKAFDPIFGTAYAYEDQAFGRQILDTMHETARASAPDMLPLVLATITHNELQSGDWLLALAHSTEAYELATVLGQGGTRSFAVAGLATLEAGMGREEAREHAEKAIELAGRTGARSMHAYAAYAVGLLELGRRDIEHAIAPLAETGRLMREWGILDPLVIPWMPNLIEAYVHLGRRSAASAMGAELCELANRTGLPWAHAVAARCMGLLADDFDRHFRRSLELFASLPTPFDRARTELAYAERLRRAGRRREARPVLNAAIETFRRLGAEPWVARADSELGGTAEHVRSRNDSGEQLSPQELQVALLVGEGRTNREVAAALFVTPKTVEYHLGHVYRKLGIRSRSELARLMATRDSAGVSPAE